MRLSNTTVTLACAASLLALSPAADKVSFQPADGTEATKSFSISGDFALENLSVLMDGNDMAAMIGEQDVSGDFEATSRIVDRYVKTVDGQPRELQREYVVSSAEWSMMEDSGTNENLSELDGETIVFKWNEETKAYDIAYADGEGDPDKIKHEGIDLDYRSLLPGKDVEAGDRWKVERDGMVTALFFGLEVSKLLEQLDSEDAPPELEEFKEALMPELGKLFEGLTGECEYVGKRDESGTEVGVIKLTVRSEGTSDLAAVISDLIESQIGGQGVEFDISTAALTLAIQGEGELLWNLGSGRAHAFAFESDAELGLEVEASFTEPGGGANHTSEMSADFLSHLKWSMTQGE
jgi:hypothetical protein